MFSTFNLIISLFMILFAVLLFAAPKPEPRKYAERIGIVVGVAFILPTTLGVVLIPTTSVSIIITSAVLLLLAVAAPLLGLLQRRVWKGNDDDSYQKIYSEKREGATDAEVRSRFRTHLVTNVLGTGCAVLIMVFNAGMHQHYPAVMDANTVSNVVIPFSVYISLRFARSQQVHELTESESFDLSQSKDNGAKSTEIIRAAAPGYMMDSWHELANTIYLAMVISIGSATIVASFAGSLLSARDGAPLPLSWGFAAAIISLLLFTIACSVSEFPSVYTTFQLGTPAVLCFALVWTMQFESSLSRNLFGLLMTLVTYSLYCVLTYRHEKKKSEESKDKTSGIPSVAPPDGWGYASINIFTLSLVGLLLTLYLTT